MPKRPGGQQRPCDAVSADDWPNGPLADDAAVRYVQLIARALDQQLTASSLRAISQAAGMSATTVIAIRDGTRYPDTRTLARLEEAVAGPLLPDWRDRVPGR